MVVDVLLRYGTGLGACSAVGAAFLPLALPDSGILTHFRLTRGHQRQKKAVNISYCKLALVGANTWSEFAHRGD